MTDLYGDYTVMDGVLNEIPQILLEEVKQLVEMKVKECMTEQGVNINNFLGEHVIQQQYRNEGYKQWSKPTAEFTIPCITIGYKMARKVSA